MDKPTLCKWFMSNRSVELTPRIRITISITMQMQSSPTIKRCEASAS